MQVEHDIQGGRFLIRLGEHDSRLDYQREGNRLNLLHVFVPPEHRGRGIAGKLAKAALEYAREQGYSVAPRCSYIANEYLPRHLEYQSLVQS
jgi:predicted GNAT family acetyltransferase